MDKLNTNNRRKGLLLLLMYLTILVASTLHVHDNGHERIVCQDCLSHVVHNGHISQGTIMELDCLLCKTLQTSYTTPLVLSLSAAVLLVFTFSKQPTPDVVLHKVTLPSLRAPPVMG